MNEGWVALCARAVQTARSLSDVNDLIAAEQQIQRDENERAQAAARLRISFVPTDRPSNLTELYVQRSQLERQLAETKDTLRRVLA